MATENEELAALREQKQKAKFFEWLDEWWTAKQEAAANEGKTRTERKTTGNGGSFLGGLFG